MLHDSIWLHVLVLDIFRPFISIASLKQLRWLIVMFSGRPLSKHTMLGGVGLLYVANAALKDRSDPEWLCYFLLCIDGYRRLSDCYQVAQTTLQGLLAMAVNSKALTSADAQPILSECLKRSQRRPSEMKQGKNGFVVDLDLAATDRNAAQVDTMVEKLEDVALFDEFTSGIV